MGTKEIKDLFENWHKYDELETAVIIRDFTDNYNPELIKAVIGYYKNFKDGLELDVKNFWTLDETTGKYPTASLNYDRLGDVEFSMNDKEYDYEDFFTTMNKILSKHQLSEVIDSLEARIAKHKEPEVDKVKKEFKDFFNADVKTETIEKIQKEFKDYDNKKMAFLIYLLHKEFNLINYSVNSRDMSRKHFVESLVNKKIRMQGINKYFELSDVKLKISKFEKDNDYISTKGKLSKTII